MAKLWVLLLVATLAGCATVPPPATVMPMPELQGEIVETRHAGADDLLSAGLGLDGLRLLPPPASPDPDAAELRRRSIWHAWRGIADLRPQTLSSPLPSVPGREYAARLRLPGDRNDHSVLLQVPDNFDAQNPCLLVAPASGSRGVYGAIAVAGPVGLPRGCAIVYTDKGAGSDFRLLGDQSVYVPHAHSGDNPEARWGEYTALAARYALHVLNRLPQAGGRQLDAGTTRVVAVGISNGGGAVLRAAELDAEGLFDAVVAAAPNIQPEWTGMRPLYDYVTEAALYQPCLLADPALAEAPFVTPELRAEGLTRCRMLRQAGLLESRTRAGLPREAHERLRSLGWEEGVLRLAGQNIAFDLWRAIAVTYASSYGRFGPGQHPCGYSFAAVDGQGRPRAPGELEQRLWRSEGSGIPPTAGVGLVDPLAAGDDAALPGLMCLRRLWDGEQTGSAQVRAGVDAVRATGRPRVPRLIVLHGRDDALIPAAFTSRPYVDAVRAHQRPIEYREIERAQHFDAFLALPAMAGYVPLLPEVWRAIEEVL